jgi:drug/metabolite transporter (DMT)-like permease
MTATTENRTKGIMWMLATMLCFIALDAIMKAGMETMSLVQVTWGRFFFATLAAILMAGRNLPRLAVSHMPALQMLRSLLLMVTTGLFNAGIKHVPLATATTIMFMSPIFVTVLSVFLLREHVGIRRWTGVAVAFIGALIVTEPWSASASTEQLLSGGLLFLFAAAFTNAGYQIATRRLRFDAPMTSLLFTAAAGALVTSALLQPYWSAPSLFEWVLLVTSGAIGCISHLCLINAFQNAPASVVAPFSYSSIIWATLFGFAIWGDVPTLSVVAGSALIIASGLYIYFRESRLTKSA